MNYNMILYLNFLMRKNLILSEENEGKKRTIKVKITRNVDEKRRKKGKKRRKKGKKRTQNRAKYAYYGGYLPHHDGDGGDGGGGE